MPMSKEEKNAQARAKRAAKQVKTPVMVQNAIPVFTESLPVSIQSVQVNGQFVPDGSIQDAENAVSDLITAQQGADGAEHKAIVRMFELLAIGVASPKEFATRYADIVAERGLKLSSLAARKSNLKKVLEFSGESADFTSKVIEDGSMGLQAMYSLRAELLKLNKPETDKVDSESDDEPTDDDTPSMSPHDLVLHKINNAIDAAADAGYADIVGMLRDVFYTVKTKELQESIDALM